MSKIQYDVKVANSVAIDVANDVLSVWWMDVNQSTLSMLTNQNRCYMPKLNDIGIIHISPICNELDKCFVILGLRVWILVLANHGLVYLWW